MPVKRATTQRGFTLIEIIIAIAIFGILTAIAVPSFNVWQRNAQVRSDARLVKGALQQARVDAITRNESITVAFTGNNWTVNVDPPRNGGLVHGTLNGAANVTFTSRGLLDPMTEVDFTIEGYGAPFTVTISPAGNISLKRE